MTGIGWVVLNRGFYSVDASTVTTTVNQLSVADRWTILCIVAFFCINAILWFAFWGDDKEKK